MIAFIFLFGLIIGSFLNVCIYRIPIGKSIATPPSTCESCGTRLKPKDLFPVISWLVLGGKCRYCGEIISIRHTIVELLTGVLYGIVFWKIGLDEKLLPYLILTSILIVITFTDLDHQIIPNRVNLFGFIIFIVLNLFLGYIQWKDAFLGSLIGVGFLFLIALLTGGMGMGDVKLMTIIGLNLGWQNTILALFLSFMIGGAFGILLLAFKRKGRKDPIAFGPWIAMASFMTILFGQEIINWYISLF